MEHQISKTTLKKRGQRKTSPAVVSTLRAALPLRGWHKLAEHLSGPTRKHHSINLDQLDALAKEGDTFAIVGSVLGTGRVSKRFRVAALHFSASAREKLIEAKCEAVSLVEEIAHNQKATGVKLV